MNLITALTRQNLIENRFHNDAGINSITLEVGIVGPNTNSFVRKQITMRFAELVTGYRQPRATRFTTLNESLRNTAAARWSLSDSESIFILGIVPVDVAVVA